MLTEEQLHKRFLQKGFSEFPEIVVAGNFFNDAETITPIIPAHGEVLIPITPIPVGTTIKVDNRSREIPIFSFCPIKTPIKSMIQLRIPQTYSALGTVAINPNIPLKFLCFRDIREGMSFEHPDNLGLPQATFNTMDTEAFLFNMPQLHKINFRPTGNAFFAQIQDYDQINSIDIKPTYHQFINPALSDPEMDYHQYITSELSSHIAWQKTGGANNMNFDVKFLDKSTQYKKCQYQYLHVDVYQPYSSNSSKDWIRLDEYESFRLSVYQVGGGTATGSVALFSGEAMEFMEASLLNVTIPAAGSDATGVIANDTSAFGRLKVVIASGSGSLLILLIGKRNSGDK